MSVLSREKIETFKRDGVVLLEGVFDDWIETLRAGVDTNMADHGPFGRDYLGDDAIYAKRSDEISPPFRGLNERLRPGDPLAGEEFPLVFPRPAD